MGLICTVQERYLCSTNISPILPLPWVVDYFSISPGLPPWLPSRLRSFFSVFSPPSPLFFRNSPCIHLFLLLSVGDPRGVRSCIHYGDSFLQVGVLLKSKAVFSCSKKRRVTSVCVVVIYLKRTQPIKGMNCF